MRVRPISVLSLVAAAICLTGVAVRARQEPPTFRGGINLVSLNVVVKDSRGRAIRNLSGGDFEVFDQGKPVRLADFRVDDDPVSLAVLLDTSGSMTLGDRLDTARRAATTLFEQFGPTDEAGLFTFDNSLRAVVPFTIDLRKLRKGLEQVSPFGSTSLYDAVAAAARRLADRHASRRAVVVITDGFDTSSEISAVAAAGLAGSIDVPVYVLAVAHDEGRTDPRATAVEPVAGGGVARLDDLTEHTGGLSFSAEGQLETGLAVKQILTDLRTAYLLAFTPDPAPGWHQLVVRVTKKNARVRTRAGFWMTAPETLLRHPVAPLAR
ncbi:MAG TPA: VWA domain-containing protein [Vicinamibacterales bacterium]|nr:VWA domain-containing protein [Vicinamibacterales bacterium]